MSERAIRIEADGVRLYAILRDTREADAIWGALPIEGKARVREGEVSLAAGLVAPPGAGGPPSAARTGDLAWRIADQEIAFLFGGTAAGAAAAAPGLAVVGRITGDASRLARVREGARVRLTAIEG
jgi:hypothetical protein